MILTTETCLGAGAGEPGEWPKGGQETHGGTRVKRWPSRDQQVGSFVLHSARMYTVATMLIQGVVRSDSSLVPTWPGNEARGDSTECGKPDFELNH